MPLVSSLHVPFMSVLTETDSPQNSACLGAPSPIAVSKFYFSLLYYLVFLFWVTGMELRPFLLCAKHVLYRLVSSAFFLLNTHDLLKLCGLALT